MGVEITTSDSVWKLESVTVAVALRSKWIDQRDCSLWSAASDVSRQCDFKRSLISHRTAVESKSNHSCNHRIISLIHLLRSTASALSNCGMQAISLNHFTAGFLLCLYKIFRSHFVRQSKHFFTQSFTLCITDVNYVLNPCFGKLLFYIWILNCVTYYCFVVVII